MSNLTLQYNCDNYVELVHLIAGRMQTLVHENAVAIPSRYGQGFVRAQNLTGGISVMISDLLSATDIIMERLQGFSPFYVLQFNEVEVIEEQPDNGSLRGKEHHIRNSFVVLGNGQIEARNVIPA